MLSKLLDDSDEKMESFKTDLKTLFDSTQDTMADSSLYTKGMQEVVTNGVHSRPTIFVLEKLLQDLGFYPSDITPTSVSGAIDVFFKVYSPNDLSIVMTYLHLGILEGKVIKMPEIARFGKGMQEQRGAKRAKLEAKKAKDEERKYALNHKVCYNLVKIS